jgi:putative endonuclease
MLCCWKTKNDFTRHRPLYGHVIYTGYTYNIFQRLIQHIEGKTTKAYTKQFNGLIRLGYLEIHKTRGEAMSREAEIKTFSRDKKVEMIYKFQEASPEVLDFIKKNLDLLI